MFYPSHYLPEKPNTSSCGISVAYSEDGVAFSRPTLDSGPWKVPCNEEIRKKHPNTVSMVNFGVYEDAEFCVTYNPNDAPAFKFKVIVFALVCLLGLPHIADVLMLHWLAL